ncbi:dihydrolipoyl dehydrogenase [Thiohalocapsa marina]|uniref:Dihydrolipoyl dehydrogenase n=1 Tax=Thiohalocapsa marina TaxID=424902 RepID=A0A5M8FQZ8_9GAMM|nr:dihydrolipoyl dehydrogenase [Thiohalocapsa marina]KAA6186690.1 dihydrolipoyl dehydrogenase [Thiohalocapsa marina]
MQERLVDVAIIGSGSAGLGALAQVRAAGRSFVLINGGQPGTTCARIGCMPSKVMIQIAEEYYRRTHFGQFGIDGHDALSLDIPEALAHMQGLRDGFVSGVISRSTANLPPDVFIQEPARLLEPTLIEAGGQRFRARALVIATGSTPLIPAHWRQFGDQVISTDQVFELPDLPGRMAIIGLGTIGLELGQSLARMGVEITGFDQIEQVSGIADPEVNACAIELMRREFVLHLGAPAEIEPDGQALRVTAGGHSVVVDKVLCSIGRLPMVEGLGLEALGLPLNARGVPPFDPHSMQVGDLPVFLAGDVTGERQVLHEAGDEGRIAGYNAAHVDEPPQRFQRKTPLYINFCDPNIIAVGARFNEIDRGRSAVGEARFAAVGRARVMGQNRGLIRVYGERDSGRLLGCEMIGPRGEHLAHLLAWSIERGATVGELLRMPFYHPVIEGALKTALLDLHGKVAGHCPGPLVESALLEAG